jgi:hypothetical protein
MALLPIRQTQQVNIDFITPWTQERGGILCYASTSGMTFAEYSYLSTNKPIGIQLNDVENINLNYQVDPRRLKDLDVPFGIVGIGVQGDFYTDWIHITGNLRTGDLAYVGLSGTITNDPTVGGAIIGKFISPLKSQPHRIVMRGLGFSRQYVNPITKQTEWENNPSDRVWIYSPGFAKVRITL